jgi:hypothetical protein
VIEDIMYELSNCPELSCRFAGVVK